MKAAPLLAAFGFLLGVGTLSLNVGQTVHVPMGGARGPLIMSGLGPSEAAIALEDDEVADPRRDFYFRKLESLKPRIAVPLRPRGPFSLALRMDTTVRTRIDLTDEGRLQASEFVGVGPWQEWSLAPLLRGTTITFDLQLEDAPLVGRSDPENFRRYVDESVLRSDDGFDLPWGVRIAGGLLVAFLTVVALQISARAVVAAVPLVMGPAVLGVLAVADPVATALALPRLLGTVVLCAALTMGLCRILDIKAGHAATLLLLGSFMVLSYGALSFLPNHAPPDLDIHIWRTMDLAKVPGTYEGWLRYGSHYPTPSQARGAATEALGAGPPLPYSPLPYVLFYAAHAAGLDLHWSMNAIEVMSLALLLPLIFALGRAASSANGGLLAAALMAVDLPTIHRLGRAHSPAVVGGALGIAALLAFGLALPRLSEPGRWRVPALLLGLGALGYSSTPVFYALFGTALMVLIAVPKKTRPLFRPTALALVGGGMVALVLYYGHYLPGLLGKDAGSALLADPFPGRTFFVFHNESRQSLRLWKLGLFVPFLAALPLAYGVVTRGSVVVRAFLLAWVSAWAGIMLLKEPWAFSRVLRWAKEDFYVTPALALLIAIGIARIDSRPLRYGLALAGLATALYLRAQDYGFHADTLRFLR